MYVKNLAFYSTNVVEGMGRGVVVETGDDTAMGSIAALVATLDSGQTPINKEIQSFVGPPLHSSLVSSSSSLPWSWDILG